MRIEEVMVRLSKEIADVAMALDEAVKTLIRSIQDNAQSIDRLESRIEKLEQEFDRQKEK